MSDITNEQMLTILAIDPTANLLMSDFTAKWYMDSSCEISNGSGTTTGVTEHRDSPEAAITAVYNRLTEARHPKYIVSRHYGEKRCYRWNGAAFAEITGATA